MSIMPPGATSYIGVKTEIQLSCDVVERSAVRRYSQAIMDPDPIYFDDAAAQRYGGPVAPPLYPTTMMRRDFDTPDPFDRFLDDPDYDGSAGGALQGLPEITAFRGWNVLNGGSEVEFYRYMRHGERLKLVTSYEDIFERETSKGPMIFIIMTTEYRNDGDELLLRVRRTTIRRPVK